MTKRKQQNQGVKIRGFNSLSFLYVKFVSVCVFVFHFINLLLTFLMYQREYFERQMDKQVIRTNPLGKDRHYNRYWWFRRDGRIFVESSDSKQWGYYSSKEEVITAE